MTISILEVFGAKIRPESLLDRSWKPIRYRARKNIEKSSKIRSKSIENPSKIDPKLITFSMMY